MAGLQAYITFKASFLRVLWFVLVFFYMWTVSAQEFSVRTFTEDDGLPSSTVYDILQDSSGHLWFATDYGVTRYDGYRFENFSSENGLPDNSTIGMHQDRDFGINLPDLLNNLNHPCCTIATIGTNDICSG